MARPRYRHADHVFRRAAKKVRRVGERYSKKFSVHIYCPPGFGWAMERTPKPVPGTAPTASAP